MSNTLWTAAVIGAAGMAWACADALASDAPVDAQGNRAVGAVASPAEVAHTKPRGDLRGLPSWVPFGPSGADAQTVAASPTAPNLRLVGVSNAFGGGAMFRSTDNGNFWQSVSGTGTASVNSIDFTLDGTAFVGTDGNLYRSTDNGESFQMVPLPVQQPLVKRVAADPADPNTVWVALGAYLNVANTQVVFKSTDGGQTWNDVSPPVLEGFGATAMAIDPANADRVFVSFAGSFGIGQDLWMTTDGGTTWNQRGSGLYPYIIWDFAFSGNRVYVAGGQDFGSQFVGLFASDDNGENWQELSADWPSRAVTAVEVDPSNPNRIYVGTSRAGLGVSNDGGQNWTFSAGGTGNYQVNDIEFVPGTNGGQIFLGMGSIAVLRSTNGGTSFSSASGGLSLLNIKSFAVNPTNENEIAAAYEGLNDGGIFLSTDGGQTWALSNAPLPRWQRLVFGADGTLYGTHDGPLGRADDGVWRRNANGTWTNLGPGSPSTLDTLGRDIAVHNGMILFGGQEGFFGGFDAVIHVYNRNGDNQWEKAYEGGIPSEEIRTVEWLDTPGGLVALAGRVNFGQEDGASGGMLRSTNNGGTWAPSETGYPTGHHAWELSTVDYDPSTVYVSTSFSTFGAPSGVYKSTDAGATWNFQGNSPVFRTFLADPVAEGVLYGADLFSSVPQRSEDDGASYQPFANGLIGQGGNNQFVYGGANRRLYYATSSGGFAIDLPVPACPADFNNDGTVNTADITDFLSAWFNDRATGSENADFNNDRVVNTADITDFLSAWFAARAGNC